MRKNFFLWALTLIMLATTSCSKDELTTTEKSPVEETKEDNSMTFTATYADGENTNLSARTILKNGKLVWSEDDAICINGEKFTIQTISTDGKIATFKGPNVTSPYLVYYPYEDYMAMESTTTPLIMDCILPKTQIYQNNSMGIDAYPMMTYSTTTNLYFSNIFGIIKIPMTGSQKIARIRVSCNYGWSSYYPYYDGSQVTHVWQGGVVLDCTKENGGGVQLGATATDFYIALPAVPYIENSTIFGSSNDLRLTVDFIDTDGKGMTKTLSGTVNENEILPMPTLAYNPTAQVAGRYEEYKKATKGNGIDVFVTGDGFTKAQNDDASIVRQSVY